ncbi:TPR repeat region-containing protein [Antrihabitans cavernicola]|uniref:TPR repeat domain-containing protein n=1 Tax=Antrihabitans cavernicola TaxID=2495913 RepID=A0A5A7SH80_9NOCA|nr:hypothetical protein [Spelaeibacter cavernicola]KAA0024984.1 hypothetical protein FOY51_03470 [Spelaeibacter cavernicola]
MGAPTRTQVTGWNAGPVGQVPAIVAPTVTAIDTAADSMLRTIDGLAWSGAAKNAADGRADNENRQMRKVGSAFDDLAVACKNGAAAMSPMITDLQTSATSLEGDTFKVADDWSVTDQNDYQAKFAACGENQRAIDSITQLQQRRAEEAKNDTVRLQRLAESLGVADRACGQAIDAANDGIRSLAPVAAGLSATLASRDFDDLHNGKATPEELDRIHTAAQLSSEQRDALAHGRPATMSQGQFDYLNRFLRTQDGMSVDDIAHLGSNLPPAQQKQLESDLANSMQLMSNPSVHTASMSAAGQAPSMIDHGGMDRLPTQVRTLVTENPVDAWSSTLTKDGTGFAPGSSTRVSGVEIARSGDFKSLNNILGAGDKSMAEGSDLDRGLIKQASEIASATKDPNTFVGSLGDAKFAYDQNPGSFAGADHGQKDANQLASNMLGQASSDRTAIHDAFTGTNMDVTCDRGGHYNATSHIDGLLNHDWQGHDQGIGKVLGSISDNAASTDPFVNQQTGQSAHALAQYVGTHKEALLDLHPGSQGIFDDPGKQSIGALNPKMTQALGGALAHYIPNMVGVEDALVQSHGFETMSSGDVKDVFAVVDTDKHAAVSFNDAAYASISQLDRQFGIGGGEHSALGEFAGRIDWAAQSGMNEELASRIHDAGELDKAKSDIWDSVKEGVSFGVGKVPVIGEGASLGVDMSAPEAKSWLLGSVPDQHAQVDIGMRGSSASQNYNILQGLALSPDHQDVVHDPNVGRYFDGDGGLKPFDDISKQGLAPEFNEYMRDYLPHLADYQLAWITGNDPRNWLGK